MAVRQISTGQTFADSTRHMPYGKYKFVVEIDGFKRAGFNKVTGLDKKTGVRKYRDGGDNSTYHKGPGITEYSAITLERGMSEDADFLNWSEEISNLDGNLENDGRGGFRRNLSIVLQDHAGNEVKRWNIYEAFATEYSFDDLDAHSEDNLIERIVIEHEGWELA